MLSKNNNYDTMLIPLLSFWSYAVITPFAYKVLEIIPTSVLLGVFYYLAYASLKGVQLSTRTKLLITPVKHHPKVPYVTKVTTATCIHVHVELTSFFLLRSIILL